MAEKPNIKTTEKLPKKRRPLKPFTGAEGNSFAKDNQPDPALKKLGWQKLREQRHLTQGIIKMMINDDGSPTATLKDYFKALITNAQKGNPKCIETVNKAIEDDIIKVAQVDSMGNDVNPLSDVQVDILLKKINEIR